MGEGLNTLAGAFRGWGEGLIPSWPLIVGLAAFGRALAQPAALLNDPDTYLHIAAGRWMLAHVALPTADPFSHALAGATWVPHEWLAEVVLAAVFWATGWGGLVVLADKGYHGAGEHIRTPYKGKNKPESQKAANRAHAKLRGPGERANAQLKTWRILRKLRCCPWKAGKLAKAIHVLQAREIGG